jgi:hypothetical protein
MGSLESGCIHESKEAGSAFLLISGGKLIRSKRALTMTYPISKTANNILTWLLISKGKMPNRTGLPHDGQARTRRVFSLFAITLSLIVIGMQHSVGRLKALV